MRSGPAPTPQAIKALKGFPRHESNAKRHKKEPKFHRGALPPPPGDIQGKAREEWLRISAELHNLGLLTSVDINLFGAYCNAYAIWIEAREKMATGDGLNEFTLTTDKGNIIFNPLYNIARQAALDMVRFGSEFGFGPASRARVAQVEAGEQDEFSGLLEN